MVPISGDVEMASLGLSVEDEALLIDSVSVVIHCAASVKFDEELGKALNTNVLGTLRLVKLAKRMRKLKVRTKAFFLSRFHLIFQQIICRP